MTPYRILLHVLPRSFREEFADEMVEVFQDQLRRAGASARLGLWVTTVMAIVALSLRLRLERTTMDLKHAVRGLARHKIFTATAVLTLALALGPLTAVFSVLHHVLLNPLPGVNIDNVVYVWATNPARNVSQAPWSELNFLALRERQQGFLALAAFTGTSAAFGGDSPQQVYGAWVSPDIFTVLGIEPAEGRRIQEADTEPGAPPVIVLSHALAHARFGGSGAVGSTVVVDDRPTLVVGVLPASIRYPVVGSFEADFWQPLTIDRANSSRGSNYLNLVGRLAPGTPIAAAAQSLNMVSRDLEREYPTVNTGIRVDVVPAATQLTRAARRIVPVLALAALAIFSLACTNIASLMVVRTAARQTEFAVRVALGAGRARLTRQLLIEHAVLATAGATVALGVSWAMLRILAVTALVPALQVARARLDRPALLFLVAVMALTTTALAWLASRHVTHPTATGTAGRTQSSSREVVRVRQGLVGLEVAAATVLLAAAGLLIQSAARLTMIDPGFQSDKVITFAVGIPPHRYLTPADRVRFIDAVVERLSRLPGVIVASSAAGEPMGNLRASRRFAIDGRPLPEPGDEPSAIDSPAGPGYASALGLRILDGRWIEHTDRAETAPVVVVSESFARRHFPGEQAVGHRIRYYAGRPGAPPPPMPEIVGVVSDVRQLSVAEVVRPQIYTPQAQRPFAFSSFFVRTERAPAATLGTIEAAVREVDPDRPVERLQVMAEIVAASTLDRRALSALLGSAAFVALLIAAVGVYGVTAATTSSRKRELAIRAAIGADRRDLLQLVVRQSLTAAAMGVAIGLAAGLASSSLLSSVLFEVDGRDPVTFGLVGATLLAASGIATYVPARRALTASPAEALRAD